MTWEALNRKRLTGLLASLNRHHSALQRMLRALERDGLSPSEDPLYRHLVQAADAIADARFLLRTRLQRDR
jgi:hypothetical protein